MGASLLALAKSIYYVQYLQAEVISSNTENNFFFTKKSLSIKTHLPYRISSNNSRPSINRPFWRKYLK